MLMLNEQFSGRDPYDCSHCSGGVCDPATGACVKGNFEHLLTGSTSSCFNLIHFDKFSIEELGNIVFSTIIRTNVRGLIDLILK